RLLRRMSEIRSGRGPASELRRVCRFSPSAAAEATMCESGSGRSVSQHRNTSDIITAGHPAFWPTRPSGVLVTPRTTCLWNSLFVGLTLLMLSATPPAVGLRGDDAAPRGDGELFARDNLVAWCIVPFDAQKRSPAQRAAMIKRLGLRRVAYDWRDEHVPTFEDEILEYQRHGIEYFAFWDVHPEALELFRKHKLRPQIWKIMDAPEAPTQAE